MVVGYARVSTEEQNPQAQADALKHAGVAVDNLNIDHTFRAKSSRPQWDVVDKVLRAGTCSWPPAWTASGAPTPTSSLLDDFRQRGLSSGFWNKASTPPLLRAALAYRMLAAVAEFQRNLTVANTHEGLVAARSRGQHGGRRPKLTAQQAELAQQLYDTREKTVQLIAELFSVPRTTVYGYRTSTRAER